MKPTHQLSGALASVTALAFAACAGPTPSEVRPTDNAVRAQGQIAATALDTRFTAGRLPRPLGEYVGHYSRSTGRITFDPVQEDGPSGGRPLGGYVALSSNTVSLEDNGTTVLGPATFGGGASCAANQICAVVTVTNDSARLIENLRVEINTLTAGNSVANSDAIGTGHPSTAGNNGGWNYGSLNASNGSNAAPWIFNTSAGADFNFTVKVWGSYTRTSYTASAVNTMSIANNTTSANAAWSDNAPAWRDACLTGTELFAGQSAYTAAYVTPPFPFSVYDTTIDADTWADSLEISSAGTISLAGVGTGANAALNGTGTPDYTFFPFWDDLVSTNGQVCSGLDTTSASPNRRFVATWKNVSISGFPNSRLTFSAVMQEGSDRVWFLYHRWSASSTSCSTIGTGSNEVRGGTATIGVRGPSGSASTQISLNSAVLPVHPITCPGAGAYYTLTAAPSNP
jgi:hypothetical protein